MKIIARSPARISLFGGGTDVDPFASEYGGKVLNMAINIRHKGILVPKEIGTYNEITAMNDCRKVNDLPNRGIDKKFDLIYEILRSYEFGRTFWFEDKFEGIQSAGLGSSASAAVSMIGAFNKWLGIEQTKEEIAEKAWQMEINLGWISGKQDQYASVLGGVNFLEFDHKVWNEPIEKGICEEFVRWCLLVFSGKTRHSSDIQKKLRDNMSNPKAISALKKMRTMAWEGRDALKKKNYHRVGQLLADSWEAKKVSNPAATNERLNGIFDKASANGAIGGKILGAGGEGHILFIVEPSNRQRLLNVLKLQEIDFSIDYNGLEVKVEK